MDIHEQIGSKIRELRLKKGIKTKEFADFMGLSPSAVSLIETGKSKTSAEQLINVAQYFGTTVAYLIGEQESKPMATTDVLDLRRELEATKKELSWAKGVIRLLDKEKLVQVDEILGKLESSWRKATFSTFGG